MTGKTIRCSGFQRLRRRLTAAVGGGGGEDEQAEQGREADHQINAVGDLVDDDDEAAVLLDDVKGEVGGGVAGGGDAEQAAQGGGGGPAEGEAQRGDGERQEQEADGPEAGGVDEVIDRAGAQRAFGPVPAHQRGGSESEQPARELYGTDPRDAARDGERGHLTAPGSTLGQVFGGVKRAGSWITCWTERPPRGSGRRRARAGERRRR